MLYEMVIENELTDGIFAISLVNSPAIQEDFVLLSKDDKIHIDIKLEKISDKKRKVVCGAILIPDMVIPRQNYDIIFSKETVRKLSENYIINGNKDNVTLEHKIPVNKIKMIESWIVEDSEKDKSSVLGMNLPIGSWVGSFKIEDDNLWNEYLASGVLRGFSLEGNFGSKEVQKLEHIHTEYEEEELALYDLYLALTYPVKELNNYYLWKYSKEEDNCPSCKKFNGQIKKLKDWITTAIPAKPNGTVIAGQTCSFPYDPYGTLCEQHCHCKLVKVNAPSFKKSVVKKRPI